MNRCQKRKSRAHTLGPRLTSPATQREFVKLCQAIGLGFIVMGAIGYAIRIIHIPVNQILVS
jgi:protein transport protein SEC61 subunit gamma-like protein